MKYKNTLDHNLQFSPYVLKPGEIFDDSAVPKTKKKIWKALTSLTNSGILKVVTDADTDTSINAVDANPVTVGGTSDHFSDSGAGSNLHDEADATEFQAEDVETEVEGGVPSNKVDNAPVKKRGRKAVVR